MQPELYQHQKDALRAANNKGCFAFFMEQGTGKSAIVVHEVVSLIEQGEVNCVVVLAPNQVHLNWQEQFAIHGPADYNKWMIQAYRSSDNKIKREELTRAIIRSGKVLVFLMNIEALSHSGGEYLARILRARSKTYLVIDESHKIKTPGAKRTKEAIKLGALAKYRRIATGTEAEEGLENLYAQMKFLSWQIIGAKTFVMFKNFYCVMGGFEGHEIIGYRNREMLANRIAPFVFQKRKKDCLDLPDKVYVTHRLEMTSEQAKLYGQLEEELIAQLENGAIIDATIAITQIMRLQQVLCGHISGKDLTNREQHMQVVDSNRAKLTSELVEAEAGKSIVFCRFVKDVELVCNQLFNDRIECVGVTGQTQDRLEQIDIWRRNPQVKALVMTVAVGGTGLTLNEAANTIFYSNDWSATNRLQAEDRNHRIGQVNKVTYHDLIVANAIDEKILLALRQKFNLSAKFRQLVNCAYPGEAVRHFLRVPTDVISWQKQEEIEPVW